MCITVIYKHRKQMELCGGRVWERGGNDGKEYSRDKTILVTILNRT